MNIQRKNSAHHFRMQSEREQTLVGPYSFIHTVEVNGNFVKVLNMVKGINDISI